MRIAVTVKDVPDVASPRRLGPDGRLVRDGGDNTLNELDENAVQAAVDLGRGLGAEVVALAVGPAQSRAAVRHALQLGADSGVLVSDDSLAGLDAPGTGTVLAAAILATGGADLVLCGMTATDGLTGLVPAVLAGVLGLPLVTLAAEVSLRDGTLVVRRELPGVTEQVTVPLPAVVSVTDAVNEPEVPGFKAIMAARKKPVAVLALRDLGPALDRLGGAAALAPRTRVVAARPVPERTDRVLVEGGPDAAAALAAWLVDRHLV